MTEKEALKIVLKAAVNEWAADTRNRELRIAIGVVNHAFAEIIDEKVRSDTDQTD